MSALPLIRESYYLILEPMDELEEDRDATIANNAVGLIYQSSIPT